MEKIPNSQGRAANGIAASGHPSAHFGLRPAPKPLSLAAQRMLFVGHCDESLSHPHPQSPTCNSETYKALETKSFLVTSLAAKLNLNWHESDIRSYSYIFL